MLYMMRDSRTLQPICARWSVFIFGMYEKTSSQLAEEQANLLSGSDACSDQILSTLSLSAP